MIFEGARDAHEREETFRAGAKKNGPKGSHLFRPVMQIQYININALRVIVNA